MKMILVFLATFGLGFSSSADQLRSLEIKSLEASARFVFVGKVTSTNFNQKEFTGSMDVTVESVIKGKLETKALIVPVNKNPLSGFDVLLDKGDVAVFFVREIKNGKAHLAHPGASAVFPKGHFH